MSKLTGKCDLLDHVYMEVQRTKDGELWDGKSDYHGALYSDLYECYKVFKEKTNGILYRHVHIREVNKFNHDFVAKHCKSFKVTEVEKEVPDKRSKTGVKKQVSYLYTYWGKEYTSAQLKKKGGVYITVEIHFNDLIELIQFLPCIVESACFSEGKEIIYISEKSFAETWYESCLQDGIEADFIHKYRKEMANLYRSVVLGYYNSLPHVVVEELVFSPQPDGRYLAYTKNDIDDESILGWRFEDDKVKPHWTSPVKVGDRCVEMSKQDYLNYIGPRVKIMYVEKFERPLILF